MRKLLTLAILSLMLTAGARAQELRHEVAVKAGAGVSSMRYKALAGDNPFRPGFKAGLGYTFFLSEKWGIGTGVEIARYNNRITLPDGVMYSTPVLDGNRAGQRINRIAGAFGFVEKQNLTALQIPLTIQFNAPAGKSVRFYSLAGVKVGLPIMASYSQSASAISAGTLTMAGGEGNYREEISRNGYTNDGGFEAGTAVMLTGEVGAKFRLSEKMWLYTGVYIDYGLNDVRKNAAPETNLIHYNANSPDATTGNSLMQMSSAVSKANPLSFGFNISLGFRFGKKRAPKPEPAPVVREVIIEKRDTVVQEVYIRDTVVQEVVKEVEVIREVPQEIKQSMINLSNTLFAFDRWNLTPEAAAELDKVVAWLRENPQVAVEIEGHTDDRGTADYNLRLSEERAKAVYDYFAANGIDPSRLSYRGYGLTRPIAGNDTQSGRGQNRRVELKITNN